MGKAEICVSCGSIIPEGRQICPNCEKAKKVFKPIYAVDFDGTLCESVWPDIGVPNNVLIKHLIKRKSEGAKLILWTCRSGERLEEAVRWCRDKGLFFDAVNENLPEMIEKYGNDTRKIYATCYIDDLNASREKYNLPFRPEKYCNTCKWHDDFSWACCNGESEHRAEFMEPVKTCAKWEGDGMNGGG